MHTTFAYDDADRLISVTDAAGHLTSYTYDTENNLTGITRCKQQRDELQPRRNFGLTPTCACLRLVVH